MNSTAIILLHLKPVGIFQKVTSVPGFAHGKMYKRATFGPSCHSLGTRLGGIAADRRRFINYKQSVMKKDEKEVRKHFVKTRMNDEELKKLQTFQRQTTEKDLSSYLRKIALHKPVTVTYRNKSADDFLQEMVQLKKELNGIGNNFNQAVHKLHILDKIPEFRTWLNQYDGLQRSLVNKVEEIRLRMNQLYEQWLQK